MASNSYAHRYLYKNSVVSQYSNVSKGAGRVGNSVDPDQTALESGSTLFVQTCMSEYLGSFYYS